MDIELHSEILENAKPLQVTCSNTKYDIKTRPNIDVKKLALSYRDRLRQSEKFINIVDITNHNCSIRVMPRLLNTGKCVRIFMSSI
ncbi:MAG: hypothetical protein GY775_09460 [Candidatus Scalindua sp.]|nr:hypothetical protein [Candidatus Scalindua sp.]